MNSITKETRLEAYITRPTTIKKQVYEALDKPMTLRELASKLNCHVTKLRPRATELTEEHKIETCGIAIDLESKKRVAVYRRVTDANTN